MSLDVAITGIGVVSALGHAPRDLFDRLVAGESAVREAPWTRDDPERFEYWAPVVDFVPPSWMDERKLSGIDPFAQHAGAAVTSALADSGLAALDDRRTAIVVGTSKNGTQTMERVQYDVDRLGRAGADPKMMIKVWPNMAAAQIAMRWKLHGPCLTITTACASSLDAIGLGARLVASGQADVALVGGTEGGLAYGVDGEFVPASGYARYGYGMGSARVTDPGRACQPFDVNRAGMVMGEGSGMFVLESAAHARARGARVHAWIQGWGTASEAYHPSTPDPSGEWERLAMSLAIDEARIAPDDVDVLVAHATGTPKGDIAEIRAVNDLFGAHAPDVSVTSPKGILGHPAGGAGAINLAILLEGLRRGQVAPTGATTDPEPEIRFDLVLGEPRKRSMEWMQVNAFGFGGQNASLVLSAGPR
ncbi:beta-ketoacyl-[acyl-carrier-protein] synthase family protein [Phytohabitans suffuscus]|uniref:3-oxoacyl-[acyl-carrier-protein] synthase 2 n=1 Tax=Phytohabitans suffuscus TaxID=624315 RepID=A0A6F8YA21_9ACTN|nr:beta-ketoacyl-[acyl-carrier-protein] synthase family protein [Phytohabitans suffuscus]BCB82801.1 3-oxoacyl-[acyl-carrier-protein] synthase 2 [Phytohabitans suffuscus]